MWLPKDERHLLLGYYVNIFNIDDKNACRYLGGPKWFVKSDWIAVLAKSYWMPILTPWLIKQAARKISIYSDRNETPPIEDKSVTYCKKEVKTYIRFNRRLEISNAGLEKRKLINIQKHERCDGVAGISLTNEGRDLGRQYNSWWLRSNLWYAEYIRNHWIWVIISFLGGIFATLLVQWLSKVII